MKETNYKAWFYGIHDDVIGTEIIHMVGHTPSLDLARRFADLIADEHYPDCIRIEVLQLAKKRHRDGRHGSN